MGPWPKQLDDFRFGSVSGLAPGKEDALRALESMRFAMLEGNSCAIPDQPERLAELLRFERFGHGVFARRRPDRHYLVALQELSPLSLEYISASCATALQGTVKSSFKGVDNGVEGITGVTQELIDNVASVASDLQLEEIELHDDHIDDCSRVLATGRIAELSNSRVGVLSIQGPGGEYASHAEKAEPMLRLLVEASTAFEATLRPHEPALFLVMGDWKVQWTDDNGSSPFEDLGFTHFMSVAGADGQVPASMYSHEHGNYGTLVDHIAWKAYGGLQVDPGPTAFVEEHTRFVNAATMLGYWQNPCDWASVVSDHAPVGVSLRLRLNAGADASSTCGSGWRESCEQPGQVSRGG